MTKKKLVKRNVLESSNRIQGSEVDKKHKERLQEEKKVIKKEVSKPKIPLTPKVKGYKMYQEVSKKLDLRVDGIKFEAEKAGNYDLGISASQAVMFYVQLEEKLKLLDIFRRLNEFDASVDITNKELKDHLKKIMKDL